MNGKVAIIMPVHNGEKTIGKAIESILCQTYEKWEIFIVDDGSNDSTCNIVKKFMGVNDKIHLFISKNRMSSEMILVST